MAGCRVPGARECRRDADTDAAAGSPAFEYETAAARVVFGRGLAAANVDREVARLRAQRIMLIAASSESDLAR